jgi:hypothetical protein
VGSYYYYYGNSITGSESSPKYSNTSTDAQTYPTPFILDILPESNGNHATEPGAYTLTATSTSTANGGTDVSESYSRANSGASTTAETITLAGTPYSVSETINADYSATLNNGVPGQGDTGTTTFSAPSADYVNVVYTPTVGSPVSTTVPVWWGSTPLLSDTFKQIAFDLRAGFFELGLDRFGFVLGDARLDRLGRALDERLGFGQTERGDFANGLDDLDLLRTEVGEDHVEFGLLAAGRRPRGRHPERRRRRPARRR